PFFRSLVVATGCHSPVFVVRAGARHALSNGHQFLNRQGQNFVVALGDDEGVLDPYAPAVGQIHTGLHGDRHTSGKFTGAGLGDARRLVHVEADAVPETVREFVPVSGAVDHSAGGRVHRGQVGPCHGRLAAGRLRGADQAVDFALPRGGPPDDQGAGHVGVVTAHYGTEVQFDEVA